MYVWGKHEMERANIKTCIIPHFRVRGVEPEEERRASRLEWLLNLLVDDMVEAAGQDNYPVIRQLLGLGFTENELACTLGFPPEEVRQAMAEM